MQTEVEAQGQDRLQPLILQVQQVAVGHMTIHLAFQVDLVHLAEMRLTLR